MYRYNFPNRKNARREHALDYWKRQLDLGTKSPRCESTDEQIKEQIAILEAKLKPVTEVTA